jgi:hypothetical protein
MARTDTSKQYLRMVYSHVRSLHMDFPLLSTNLKMIVVLTNILVATLVKILNQRFLSG